MKKIFFIFIVCFWIFDSAFSEPVGFGLKAGVNFSNLVYDTHGSTGYDPQFGLIGGGFVDIKVLDHISIQPEAYLSMKGATKNGVYITGNGPVILATTSLSYYFKYIEMPVLIKLHLPISSQLDFSFICGPSIAFLFDAQFHSAFDNKNINVLSYCESPDYGVILGGELELSKFLFDLRYELGLTSAISHPSESNQVISLMVGYRLL
jgi:hypothetical protein